MGTRGPKPLPANVHLLRGNPSKLPMHQLAGAQVPVEVPAAPAHLLPEARREWKRITVELEKLGLVAQIDRAALAVYCQAYGRWVQAELKLKELAKADEHGERGMIDTTPSGYKQMGVWLQISNRAVDQMEKFLSHFGMSPSSRSRVTVNPQQSLFDDEPGNPADSYFS